MNFIRGKFYSQIINDCKYFQTNLNINFSLKNRAVESLDFKYACNGNSYEVNVGQVNALSRSMTTFEIVELENVDDDNNASIQLHVESILVNNNNNKGVDVNLKNYSGYSELHGQLKRGNLFIIIQWFL